MPVRIANRIALVVAALTAVAAVAVVATASSPPGPRDVAVQYLAAEFACGELGAGRQYDLSVSPERDWTRAEAIAYQERTGCRPAPVPTHVMYVTQRDDVAFVTITARSGQRVPSRLTLVLIDGQWKVDTTRSD